MVLDGNSDEIIILDYFTTDTHQQSPHGATVREVSQKVRDQNVQSRRAPAKVKVVEKDGVESVVRLKEPSSLTRHVVMTSLIR